MNKYFSLFLTIMIFTSCVRTGYFYTDRQDGNDEYDEYVPVTDDSIKKVGLAVSVIDTSLTVTIFFKLLDSARYKKYNIDSVYFSLNNLYSSESKKTILFIDQPLKVKYNELSEIINLDERIHTGLPLELLFDFNKKSLANEKRIKIKIRVALLENGKQVFIEKAIEMIRHERYRFWLATR